MRIIQINENNAHYWHRRLWLWLAKNPLRGKRDWPGWEYVECGIHRCFACEIARSRHLKIKTNFLRSAEICKFCPIIEWAKNADGLNAACTRMDKQFYRWDSAARPATKTRLALEIANLEWKAEK